MNVFAASHDFIEELRLRRWARENYVAAEGRNPAWATVILHEMDRRDRELAHGDDDALTGLVPLAPASHEQPGWHITPARTLFAAPHATSTELHLG
jgi:hypothetical protein